MPGRSRTACRRSEAEEIWELITKFAGYGFNKSHSTAYALIAYQTAYLKAHYPVEFMAALLSGDIPGRNFVRKDALVEHMEDSTRMNITVVPPDVNSSHVDFAVADGRIHFGLAAIKGCGGSAAEAIVRERDRGGPFRDLFDFCERVDATACNHATIETLIKAGAFDSFGARRSPAGRRDRPGDAVGRRRAGRSPQRPEEPVRRFGRGRVGSAGPAARYARMGGPGTAGHGEGSAGLLPFQPSAGRIREDAVHVLLPQHGRDWRTCRIARRSSSAA